MDMSNSKQETITVEAVGEGQDAKVTLQMAGPGGSITATLTVAQATDIATHLTTAAAVVNFRHLGLS